LLQITSSLDRAALEARAKGQIRAGGVAQGVGESEALRSNPSVTKQDKEESSSTCFSLQKDRSDCRRGNNQLTGKFPKLE
jgi:hypothetical protein